MTRAQEFFASADFESMSPGERKLVLRIRETLKRIRPAGVDPGETVALTEPMSGTWTVLPHRDLDGFALAAAVYQDKLRLFWLDYATLEHLDDLDRDVDDRAIASLQAADESWPSPALACFEQALREPLEVEVSKRGHRVVREAIYQSGDGVRARELIWARDADSGRPWRRCFKPPVVTTRQPLSMVRRAPWRAP